VVIGLFEQPQIVLRAIRPQFRQSVVAQVPAAAPGHPHRAGQPAPNVFQVGVDGAGAAAQLAKLGLIADADGDPVSVRDAEALDLIEGLTGVGVSLEQLVATLVDVRGHQRSIADMILRAYAEDVWEPFVSSKFATPDWGSLADNAERGRRLVSALLTHLQQTAFDDAAASVMLREVDQAERALDRIKPTHERL